jgi:hypothetical protein
MYGQGRNFMQRKAKATSFPWLSGALNPHLSAHGFHQFFAVVESKAGSSYRP